MGQTQLVKLGSLGQAQLSSGQALGGEGLSGQARWVGLGSANSSRQTSEQIHRA